MSAPPTERSGSAHASSRRLPEQIRVRPMEEADLDHVVTIEALSFTTPWRAASFCTLLDRPGAVLRVLEVPPRSVAGYAVLWCIQDQGELANIAVAPELRDLGLGGYLLDRMTVEALERGVESLFLEVRVSNFRGRAMYGARGFREIGVRREYYEMPKEDARVLMKRLAP